MTRFSIDSLALVYELLKGLDAFVTVEPPADLAKRLPAIVVEASAPGTIANHGSPAHGALCTVTLTALSKNRAEASALCDTAYQRLFDSRGVQTEYGWINRVTNIQLPHLGVRGGNQSGGVATAADGVYQFRAAVNLTLRRTS